MPGIPKIILYTPPLARPACTTVDHRRDVVRIPPERPGPRLDTVLTELAQQQFEGKLVDGSNLTVMIRDVTPIGEGHIVHGDGGVYQEVEYQALLFRPEIQEVVEGNVVEIRKFGAFVRFGPLDGLLHVSQIMDDRVNIDEHNQRLVGVETKKDLKVGYKVRSRVVSLSLSEISPRDSRIGLTMRQPGPRAPRVDRRGPQEGRGQGSQEAAREEGCSGPEAGRRRRPPAGRETGDGHRDGEVRMISLKACKTCSSITELNKCPRCGGEVSREWQGYLLVIDPEKSEIARKMGIHASGRYALRVK